ncbi:hypothetical protein WJX73_005731 [Symbiochloris irregularis]|uniref:TATA box binding protein associated factor (TAF) histone-like fold domain-containing protein n=1 Tax=Symbiochloris irregularis TaxID=706552 RepID=A0AAW1PRM3_9CHLO
MSVLSADRVKIMAESLDTERMSNSAAGALAPHIEMRLREVIQEASKFARHSKRARLFTEDINNALKLRNVEPTYGFSGKDPLRFIRAATHSDLFYVDDPTLSLEQVIEQPLPKCPVEVGVNAHWLAVDGVQPAIPENAAVGPPPSRKRKATEGGTLITAGGSRAARDAAAAAPAADKAPVKAPGGGKQAEAITMQLPMAHVLSKELQTYFDRASSVLLMKEKECTAAGEKLSNDELHRQQSAIFASLATDPGLHPLVPYLMRLVSEEVPKHMHSTPRLQLLLKAARSLLQNSEVNLGPYIHILMPALLSCALARRIGEPGSEDHLAVRESAAHILALACARLGGAHASLQPRVTREYVKALTDEGKPLRTHYGAIKGLTALGPTVTRLLLVPHLAAYLTTLTPLLEGTQAPPKRREAQHVFGALCHAACSALFAAARKDLAAGVMPNTSHAQQPPLDPTAVAVPEASKRARAAHTAVTANPRLAPKRTSSSQTAQKETGQTVKTEQQGEREGTAQGHGQDTDAARPSSPAPEQALPRSTSDPLATNDAAGKGARASPGANTRSGAELGAQERRSDPGGSERRSESSAGQAPGTVSPTRRMTRRASSLAKKDNKDPGQDTPQHSAQSKGGTPPPSAHKGSLPHKPSHSAASTGKKRQQQQPAASASVEGGAAGPLEKNASFKSPPPKSELQRLSVRGSEVGDASKAAEGTAAEGMAAQEMSKTAKDALGEAWREGGDVGAALMALREFFGEPMLPYFWPARLADISL